MGSISWKKQPDEDARMVNSANANALRETKHFPTLQPQYIILMINNNNITFHIDLTSKNEWVF